MPPLLYGCTVGAVGCVECMLMCGWTTLKCHPSNGWSPFLCAASEGHTNIIRLLSAWGLEGSGGYKNQEASAIHLAARNGHERTVGELMEQGADVNFSHPATGALPIHEAVSGLHVHLVDFLMSKGSAVVVKNMQGDTPLHVALECLREHVPSNEKAPRKKVYQMVTRLILAGADPFQSNKQDIAPIQLMVQFQVLRKISVLKSVSEYEETGEMAFVNLKLQDIPAYAFGSHFINVKSLILAQNVIQKLPNKLSIFTNLETLDVQKNKIADSGIPAELSSLVGLKKLDLSHNFLTKFPPELAALTSLKWLSLGHNSIGKIPTEIGNLADLETLKLNHNQISWLPAQMGKLVMLKAFDLTGNDLKDMPPFLAVKPPLEMIEFFKTTHERAHPLGQGRMVVVGGTGVGKSSLCRCLWGDMGVKLKKDKTGSTILPEQDNPADLTIRPWVLRPNKGEEEAKKLANLSLRPVSQLGSSTTASLSRDSSSTADPILHVWDFGSQALLTNGLPFFLCHEKICSLVLVMVSGLDTELLSLQSWLRVVRSKDRKLENVVIVVTHIDLMNEEIYRKLCSSIQTIAGSNLPIIPINSSDPSFVPDLAEAVLKVLSRLRWWTDNVPGKLILTQACLSKEAQLYPYLPESEGFFFFSFFFFLF